MGRLRGSDFDAVIGIGGISANPVREGIDRKINWIGIAPHVVDRLVNGNPILAFERFYLREEAGLLLAPKAPKLAKRMYTGAGVRFLLLEDDAEAESILKLAKNSEPSMALLKKNQPKRTCRKPPVTHKRKCHEKNEK